MLHFLCFLVLAVIYGINGESCVPNAVSNLSLDENGTLHWQPSTNCDDTSYIIYIVDSESEQYYYETDDTKFDITHLAACVTHYFTVTAIANYVLSADRRIIARTPADPDTQSPTITKFTATPQGNDTVLLEWDLDPQFAHCARYFRVVVRDDFNAAEDKYTIRTSMVVDNLATCTDYVFTVTAIYNSASEGLISLVNFTTPAHTAHTPDLVTARPGITYADMSWSLPSYTSNRCPISALIFDASPYLNLTIPISDSPSRPLVPVHLSPLQSDRMYLFRVTMINSAGPSAPVLVAVQTLPDTN